MDPVRVAVYGALGKMGQEVLRAACLDHAIEPVAGVDQRAESPDLSLPDASGSQVSCVTPSSLSWNPLSRIVSRTFSSISARQRPRCPRSVPQWTTAWRW